MQKMMIIGGYTRDRVPIPFIELRKVMNKSGEYIGVMCSQNRIKYLFCAMIVYGEKLPI